MLENIIVTHLGMLVPFLYIIGMILKRLPRVNNVIIPWVVVIIGALFGWLIKHAMEGIIEGIAVAGGCLIIQQLAKYIKSVQQRSFNRQKTRRSE